MGLPSAARMRVATFPASWGFRIPFEGGINLGFAYERPLSEREALTEQRVTTQVTWEF